MEELLRELLKQTNPAALLWIGGAGTFLKFGMDVVKHFAPNLQGNAVQTVTAALSFLGAVIQAGAANVAAGGLTGTEISSVLIVAALTYVTAVGVNETLTNRNKPKPEPELKEQIAQDEAQAKIDAAKAKAGSN